jgi:hypothetical protein
VSFQRNVTVAAGQLIHTVESLDQGTLGLLAHDANLRVFGLTVGTVVPVGGTALLSGKGELPVFCSARRLDTSLPPNTMESGALLVALKVSSNVRVVSNICGVAQAFPTKPITRVLGNRLLVNSSRGVRRAGILRQVGMQAILTGPDGTGRRYSGLAEVAFSRQLPKLYPGDAGALVITEDSTPVGLIVGASKVGILITPIHEFLHAAGLVPLSSWAAQYHNAGVRAHEEREDSRRHEAEAEGRRAPVPYGQTEPQRDSADLLNASKIEDLLDEIDEAMPA